jgi:hypothetical protein
MLQAPHWQLTGASQSLRARENRLFGDCDRDPNFHALCCHLNSSHPLLPPVRLPLLLRVLRHSLCVCVRKGLVLALLSVLWVCSSVIVFSSPSQNRKHSSNSSWVSGAYTPPTWRTSNPSLLSAQPAVSCPPSMTGERCARRQPGSGCTCQLLSVPELPI